MVKVVKLLYLHDKAKSKGKSSRFGQLSQACSFEATFHLSTQDKTLRISRVGTEMPIFPQILFCFCFAVVPTAVIC
eukprot:209699-Ditylum_brightwellii.AAC.1